MEDLLRDNFDDDDLSFDFCDDSGFAGDFASGNLTSNRQDMYRCHSIIGLGMPMPDVLSIKLPAAYYADIAAKVLICPAFMFLLSLVKIILIFVRPSVLFTKSTGLFLIVNVFYVINVCHMIAIK